MEQSFKDCLYNLGSMVTQSPRLLSAMHPPVPCYQVQSLQVALLPSSKQGWDMHCSSCLPTTLHTSPPWAVIPRTSLHCLWNRNFFPALELPGSVQGTAQKPYLSCRTAHPVPSCRREVKGPPDLWPHLCGRPKAGGCCRPWHSCA